MHKFKPLNDFIFGKTFGEKGDEEQLLSLLNAILAKTKSRRLVNIEIVEHRTFTAEVIGDKTSILDIRAVAEDGTRINIEVQLRDYGIMGIWTGEVFSIGAGSLLMGWTKERTIAC